MQRLPDLYALRTPALSGMAGVAGLPVLGQLLTTTHRSSSPLT
jgi:hypothetical protein